MFRQRQVIVPFLEREHDGVWNDVSLACRPLTLSRSSPSCTDSSRELVIVADFSLVLFNDWSSSLFSRMLPVALARSFESDKETVLQRTKLGFLRANAPLTIDLRVGPVQSSALLLCEEIQFCAVPIQVSRAEWRWPRARRAIASE